MAVSLTNFWLDGDGRVQLAHAPTSAVLQSSVLADPLDAIERGWISIRLGQHYCSITCCPSRVSKAAIAGLFFLLDARLRPEMEKLYRALLGLPSIPCGSRDAFSFPGSVVRFGSREILSAGFRPMPPNRARRFSEIVDNPRHPFCAALPDLLITRCFTFGHVVEALRETSRT